MVVGINMVAAISLKFYLNRKTKHIIQDNLVDYNSTCIGGLCQTFAIIFLKHKILWAGRFIT